MSTPSTDGLKLEIDAGRMRIGNQVQASTGLPQTASTTLYVDSGSNLASGNLPFALPLFAGVTSTSASVYSIEGSATGTANDLMHLTLVKGSNATATVAGYYRITVTDDAGVVTTGDYYAPFYTLA